MTNKRLDKLILAVVMLLLGGCYNKPEHINESSFKSIYVSNEKEDVIITKGTKTMSTYVNGIYKDDIWAYRSWYNYRKDSMVIGIAYVSENGLTWSDENDKKMRTFNYTYFFNTVDTIVNNQNILFLFKMKNKNAVLLTDKKHFFYTESKIGKTDTARHWYGDTTNLINYLSIIK